jgi:hypothetical protein
MAGLALMAASSAPRSAQAQLVGGIYQASVITTGNDTRFRDRGFGQALREVLVRASGEPRLANDARVDAIAARSSQLVAFFSYRDQLEGLHHHDDQGTYDRPFDLTVQFDWIRINAALAELGEKPWLGERPTIVPVILIRGHDRPFNRQYWLTDDAAGAEDQKISLTEHAQKFGLTTRVPSAADLTTWKIRTTNGFVSHLQSLSGRLVATGTLDFRLSTLGWVGVWHATWLGTDYQWGISGASYDKAFDSLFAGLARIASGHGRPD